MPRLGDAKNVFIKYFWENKVHYKEAEVGPHQIESMLKIVFYKIFCLDPANGLFLAATIYTPLRK